MTERDKVILLATKVMGWVKSYRNGQEVEGLFRYLVGGKLTERRWTPRTSIADAFEMEAAIPEEKRDAYIQHLCDIVLSGIELAMYTTSEKWFFLAHATPAQRCDAAIAVITREQ